MNNDYDYCVFSAFDEYKLFDRSLKIRNEKFDFGFYILKTFTTRHGVSTNRYMNVPYFIVQYLYDNNHITLDHIYAYIKQTYRLSKNTFKRLKSLLEPILIQKFIKH